jgi:cell division protein FtsI/penicillin-binding protein 2
MIERATPFPRCRPPETPRERTMPRTRARLITAVTAGALVLAGCGPFSDDKTAEARKAGEAFLADWAANKLPEAAARTTDAKTAETALRELQTDLRPDTRDLTAGAISCDTGKPCVLDFDVDLGLNALAEWKYSSTLDLVQQGDKTWLVSWKPSLIHPKLTAQTKLRRVRELPPRAPIKDRKDRDLVQEVPVKRVGVAAGNVPDGTIEALSELLNVNVDGLALRTNAAPEGQFVEAVVLRKADYDAQKAKLDAIPGVVTQDDKLTLAPTREFARGVLGAVSIATAASLKKAGPTASIADSVGASGLQAAYQQQLAGRPGGTVDLVDRASRSVVENLATFTSVPGTPLHTTLDFDVQTAAERALKLTGENSSLVAVDTRTGDILAVANGPVDKAGEDRALNGQYAPGSTFKIVTTTALIRAQGLKVDEKVNCPPSETVNGKRFDNYDGLGSLGNVEFRRDFMESCNTAFVRRSARLGPEDLSDAAAAFGIGDGWDLGVNTYSGDVPTATDDVERAADGIGQGRVLVSPLAMAVVAAAVASGTPKTPHLITDGDVGATPAPSASPTVPAATTAPPAGSGADSFALPPLPEADVLRKLMIDTVQGGTAQILKLPGKTIGAKTGTAEYGSETEPGKHAWMVGFMGDIAFAVIVENGNTGATTAGPIARQFLQDLG